MASEMILSLCFYCVGTSVVFSLSVLWGIYPINVSYSLSVSNADTQGDFLFPLLFISATRRGSIIHFC